MSTSRSPLVTLGATAALAVALLVVNELAEDDSAGGYGAPRPAPAGLAGTGLAARDVVGER